MDEVHQIAMSSDQIASATAWIPAPITHFIDTMTQQVSAQGPNYHEQKTFLAILVTLSIAAILGAVIAYHPKRQIEGYGPASDQELKNTKIMICIAGAIMVILIQGSLERAFGLVGLGSFVRYRTAMRNPFDLSLIFILIGLGMACGLANFELAITITGFIYILLYVLSYTGSSYRYHWEVKITTNNPTGAERAFRKIASKYKFQILRMQKSKETGRFRSRFNTKQPLDSDQLTQEMKDLCGENSIFTRFEWDLQEE